MVMPIRPVLNLKGEDVVTIEASIDAGKTYQDAGAICSDSSYGVVRSDDMSTVITSARDGAVVSVVTTDKPGEYMLTYSCVGLNGIAAIPSVRRVMVRDTTCPWCALRKGPSTIEASFPFSDPGIDCTDAVDGRIARTRVIKSGFVDVEKVGSYLLTYRVQDSAGNWNDGSVDIQKRIAATGAAATKACTTAHSYIRTVTVVDTLKPVIAMKFGANIFHLSDATDSSEAESGPKTNPAASYFVRSDGSLGGAASSLMEHSLMAEVNQHSTSAAFCATGAGLMVLGAVMLAVGSGDRIREGGGGSEASRVDVHVVCL
jgi:hypothetical protein